MGEDGRKGVSKNLTQDLIDHHHRFSGSFYFSINSGTVPENVLHDLRLITDKLLF